MVPNLGQDGLRSVSALTLKVLDKIKVFIGHVFWDLGYIGLPI